MIWKENNLGTRVGMKFIFRGSFLEVHFFIFMKHFRFHLSFIFSWYYLTKKQPFRRILRKWCSENMQQIYWTAPMPKCDFNDIFSIYHATCIFKMTQQSWRFDFIVIIRILFVLAWSYFLNFMQFLQCTLNCVWTFHFAYCNLNFWSISLILRFYYQCLF